MTPAPTSRPHSPRSYPAGLTATLRAALHITGTGALLTSLLVALGLLLAGAPSALALNTHAFSLSFASAGPGAGQVSSPAGIAIDSATHDVYVADAGNRRVDQFEADGSFVRAWGWGVADGLPKFEICTLVCQQGLLGSEPGQFTTPKFIAVDNSAGASKGDVYVGDAGDNVVSKFSGSGALIESWGVKGQLNGSTSTAGTFASLGGVAVSGSGTLVVASLIGGVSHVFEFAQDGTFTAEREVARETEPKGLTTDAAGNLFKINGDQSVEKITGSNTDVGQVTLGVTATGVAVDTSDGGLYVAAVAGVEHYAFTSLGVVSEPGGGSCTVEPGVGCPPSDSFGSEDLKGGSGVAVDPSSHNVYVADASSGKIDVFAPAVLPDVSTEAASGVAETTATMHGTVNPDGIEVTSCRFEYGTSPGVFSATAACVPAPGKGSAPVAVSATLNGLAANTTYHYRLVAADASGTNRGSEETFTTPGPPRIAGTSSEAVTKTTATLTAHVNPDGFATKYRFQYGQTTGYGTSTTEGELPAGFTEREVSAEITGLKIGATYHFRLVAVNSAGEVDGPDQEFTTIPALRIESESVVGVDDTSATLQAEINPLGTDTHYQFEYGTAPCATNPSPCAGIPIEPADIGSGEGPVEVSPALIQKLLPSTTYYYRAVAYNSLLTPGETIAGEEHTFTTQGAASSTLPDGRSWELVSPPNKHGAPLEPITDEGGLIQAAPGGGAFAYVAIAPVEADSKGARSPEDSQLLSRRGPDGWSTEEIATPHEEITVISSGSLSEYQFFAEDLSVSVVEPEGATPLSPQTTERTPYRREADGEFVPLVTASNVPGGTKFGGEERPGEGVWQNGVSFVTASPDLSHIVLASHTVLAPGFDEGFKTAEQSLYELSGGKLELISVLPNGKAAAEEGFPAAVGNGSQGMRGAVSSDGTRVFFEAGFPTHLYMRDTALARTLLLDEVQPGASGGGGDLVFQGASEDGSKVFFTDTAQLTSRSSAQTNEPDLYMCEIGESAGQPTCALSDLSVALNHGEGANVLGTVSAIDQSGTHVYFAASGVLTNTPDAAGERAVSGAANMYEYDTSTRQVRLVAVLADPDDRPDWNGGERNLTRLTARSSPNGQYFAFMSQRSLTGYDNRDVVSGAPDEEVYLFDAETDRTSCVSCDPSGARPLGVFDSGVFPGLLVDHRTSWPETWLAGSIPGWTAQQINRTPHQSRFLSDSGRTFFNASDALVPQDTNKVNDVYEYEPPGVGSCSTASSTYSDASGGCVSLISSGESKEESAFLDASENGGEVFFLTASRLTSSDVDSAFDVYDAHVCSESSPCPSPPSAVPGCEGDSCQNPSSRTGLPTPGSLTYEGPEGVAPSVSLVAKVKPPTRAQLLAKALKACKVKRNKQQRTMCEKKARRSYAPKTKPKKTRKTNRRKK